MFEKKLKSYIKYLIIISFLITVTIIIYLNFTSKAISLKGAYILSLKEAKKWDKQAELYYLTSVDSTDSIIEGANGKRRIWNVEYAVSNSNKHIVINIKNGKIKDFIETSGLNNNDKLIFQEEIVFDSTYAINVSEKNYHLTTKTGFASGNHFTLTKINNEVILTTLGEDEYGYFTRINFNASTGEVISALHKIPKEDGTYQWVPIKTINNSAF